MIKKRKKTFRQEFIERILVYNINWPREQKIMSVLINKYPEESFWSFLEITFKISSLAWFLTEKGSDFIDKKYKIFKFEPANKSQYEFDNNIQLDIINKSINDENKKIKSFREFLKLW